MSLDLWFVAFRRHLGGGRSGRDLAPRCRTRFNARGALERAGIAFLPGGAVVGPAPPIPSAPRNGGAPVRWVNATDLSQWAERRDGRSSMPELLTRLVRAAVGLTAQLLFPSDESVQLPEWDGICNVDNGTEHIPSGKEPPSRWGLIGRKRPSSSSRRGTGPRKAVGARAAHTEKVGRFTGLRCRRSCELDRALSRCRTLARRHHWEAAAGGSAAR